MRQVCARALFGGTRQEVIRQIQTGVTRLPGSCYFRLDQESLCEILRNLQWSLGTRRSRIMEEVRSLGDSLGRRPKLGEFLRETQYELGDIYKDTVAGWTGKRCQPGSLNYRPPSVRLDVG
jgi:hypothetical protein